MRHFPNLVADSVAAQRKSPSLAEPPKPFSNFPVFHDRLLDRLKSVNQLHVSFERRAKELESKFIDQLQCVARHCSLGLSTR